LARFGLPIWDKSAVAGGIAVFLPAKGHSLYTVCLLDCRCYANYTLVAIPMFILRKY
jgi:hypothetical protein